MKILGIDPAICSLGWAILQLVENKKIVYVESSIIKSKLSSQPLYQRLSSIVCSLEKVIIMHKFNAVAMEESFINNNASSSLKLAYVRGAIMALVGRYSLLFYEYKPNTVKKTVVGIGHAEKQQISSMIKMIVSNTPEGMSFDQYDALAIAYTCLMRSGINSNY